MSFNYLEIGKAVHEINSFVGGEVQDLYPAHFRLPAPLNKSGEDWTGDLCLAFDLSNAKSLVFCFKQPWFGVFLTDSHQIGKNKGSLISYFGAGSEKILNELKGKKILEIKAVEGERVVEIFFESGFKVQAHLFPAGPNLLFFKNSEKIYSWRQTNPLVPNRILPDLTCRDFGENWLLGVFGHYRNLRISSALGKMVDQAMAPVLSRTAKLQKIRGELLGKKAESIKSKELAKKGELLKSLLHSFPKDHKVDRVDAYGTMIELDREKTLAENVEEIFKDSKKLNRTGNEVKLRLELIEKEWDLITEAKKELLILKKEKPSLDLLTRVRQVLKKADLYLEDPSSEQKIQRPASKKEKKWQGSGLRSYITPEGFKIWVGKNHTENEELVIRLARGNDMWLHLKSKPGAHVIIQTMKGKSFPLEVLLDGATLAAFYSGVNEGDRVDVDYTFRKNVKRVAGQKEKFLVTYTQNKTLSVRLEKFRLEKRLKN